MTGLHDILKLLPQLSSKELARIRHEVTALMGTTPTQIESDDVLVLDAIARVITTLGMGPCNASVLRKGQQYPAFAKKLPQLIEYLDKVTKDRQQQMGLLDLGFELLYEDLASMHVPISAWTMMNHIHRLPAIFDLHFPGYARAGMLGMLFRNGK